MLLQAIEQDESNHNVGEDYEAKNVNPLGAYYQRFCMERLVKEIEFKRYHP
ncbi:uncharacterized protein J3R85_018035 [Psidium guajava]|nr:uncharacterized protein J3R85_018035 [Psidium guajava]